MRVKMEGTIVFREWGIENGQRGGGVDDKLTG